LYFLTIKSLHMINSPIPSSHAHINWSESLHQLAQKYADRLIATDGAKARLSFGDLNRYAHWVERCLSERGIHSSEPVASLLDNQLAAIWVTYGIKLNGAAEVPLNFNSTKDEILWCAEVAKFKWILTYESKADELRQLGFQVLSIEYLMTSLEQFQVTNAWVPQTLASVNANDWGRILFTSGTTGKPKGVVYSHQRRWIAEQMLKASMPFIPQKGAKLLLMTPFVHGASLMTFAWADFGAEVVLVNGVDLPKITPLLESDQLEFIFAPPTVLGKLILGHEGRTFKGVKCIFTGTQPLSKGLYDKALQMFGPVVRVTYGKSECINPITVLTPEQTHAFYQISPLPAGACVGWPQPGVEMKIVPQDEEEEGQEGSDALQAPSNTWVQGEIYLRAPQMSNFLINPEGRIEHEAEGWHATGDLGYFDAQGRLMLTGRIADVIKTGGYRVNPDEIELLLVGSSQWDYVCITSLLSEYWGEVIIAVVEGGRENFEQEMALRLKALSKHKQPRITVSFKALPRNPQGKISRKKVREMVLSNYQFLDGPYPKLEAK
jgi:malonyl-CoA/methylmalonyl-CoA synthetase